MKSTKGKRAPREDDDDQPGVWKEYRVWIKSTPGNYAQHHGKVDVCARTTTEAEAMAYRELRQRAFPDRTKDMWQTDMIEVIGGRE